MRSCEAYQELISALLDGELTEAEAAEVNAHIAACPDCRTMYEAFAAIGVPDAEEVPETLHTAVMEKVTAARKAVKTQHTLVRLRPVLTAAACLVVMVGTLFAVKNATIGGRKTAAPAMEEVMSIKADAADTEIVAAGEAPAMMMSDAMPAEAAEAPAAAEPTPMPESKAMTVAAPGSTNAAATAEEDSALLYVTLRITAMTENGFAAVDIDTDETVSVHCDNQTETAPELNNLLPEMIVCVGYAECENGIPMVIYAAWIGLSE